MSARSRAGTTPVEASLAWALSKARRADGARAGGYPGAAIILRQLAEGVARKRVGLLARENAPVKMEFNALGVRLSSSSPDLGGAVEVVEAQYEGADMVAAFNPGYLSDGLTAASGERVLLEVRDGLKPALIKGEAEEFVYLVMPVRLPAHVG